MEERYYMLRRTCENTFNKWLADKSEANVEAYKTALSVYQDFCMDMLERLMDKDPDVLTILRD